MPNKEISANDSKQGVVWAKKKQFRVQYTSKKVQRDSAGGAVHVHNRWMPLADSTDCGAATKT